MTALAGCWHVDGRPDAGADCARMLRTQALYGRDGAASWDDGDVAIGRRLFRLLPEDIHDTAPAVAAGGRFRMVGDVRIDDRAALARALDVAPDRAARLSDTALVALAWERWEAATLDRLYGDFAIAVWDARDRRLTLARDPIGMRPLHYHRSPGLIAFASMPKGLHALAEVPVAPDETQMTRLLALLPESGSRSFFAGIERVAPGHAVTLDAGGVAVRRYWHPARPTRRTMPRDTIEATRALFDAAVRARLRGAGGVVATHLSAGLDSAGVTATAARLTAADGTRIAAFTAAPRAGYDLPAPDGRDGDESRLAALTAARYPNIDHHVVRTDVDETPVDRLDRHFHVYDRPILNACNMGWSNAIDRAASYAGARVLLTGSFGNLTFSHTGIELLPDLFAGGRWLRLAAEGRALVRSRRLRWRGLGRAVLLPWLPRSTDDWLQRRLGRDVIDVEDVSCIAPDRLAAMRAADPIETDVLRPWTPATAFDRRVEALLRADPGNYMKGNLAAAGIDHRDPTIDRALVEHCLSLPLDAYLRDGRPRALALDVLADRLPAEVLDARTRGLQAVDWHEPLTAGRDRLREEVIRLANVPAAAGALDLDRMRRLIDDWPTGGWHEDAISLPYRQALLRGVVSGHFLRKASGSNA